MNKKQIITWIIVLALIVLASVSVSMNKAKKAEVSNQNQADNQNQAVIQDEPVTTNDVLQDNKNTNTKNMTDIKEFSFVTLKEGTGAPAESGKIVTVDYKGMFVDGKVFDQGTFPFKLGAGSVVAGFDKGVMGMKLGETRKIYIPSDMGYGAAGAGATIPPNSDLIFEVTLKSVQ